MHFFPFLLPSAVCNPISSEYSPSPVLLNALTRALYIELKCSPSTVHIVSFPQYTSCLYYMQNKLSTKMKKKSFLFLLMKFFANYEEKENMGRKERNMENMFFFVFIV